jgi:hypothetical protein
MKKHVSLAYRCSQVEHHHMIAQLSQVEFLVQAEHMIAQLLNLVK